MHLLLSTQLTAAICVAQRSTAQHSDNTLSVPRYACQPFVPRSCCWEDLHWGIVLQVEYWHKQRLCSTGSN